MALTGARGYRLIAEVLKDALRGSTPSEMLAIERTAMNLADLFQEEHPIGFDRERFYQNVGLIPMKESNHANGKS